MARPPTSRIMPGDPYPAKAEPWNDLVDSHSVVMANAEQARVDPLETDTLSNAVLIRNGSIQHGEGEYIIATGVLTDPGESPGMFRMTPTLTGVESDWSSLDSHWGKIAILAQDTAPDKIDLAYTSGTCIARLLRTYDYHDHADINPSDAHSDGTTPLASHPSGSWQIVWDNAVANPTTPTPGWAILRHRGIWDRTLAGTARESITSGGSGNVEIRFNGALTGEIVNAQYRWTGGPSIADGDTVEVEWQSDELLWTVAKIGTTGGTINLNPASQWSLPQNHPASAAEDLPWVKTAQDYNAPEIFLNVGDNTIIEVDRDGLYRFSYNVWVKPASLSPGELEERGTVTITKYFDIKFRRNPDNEVKAYQREKLIYVNEGAFLVDSPTQTRAANDSSISGSAFFHLQAGETVSVGYTSEVSGNLLNGDVHVNRIREGA